MQCEEKKARPPVNTFIRWLHTTLRSDFAAHRGFDRSLLQPCRVLSVMPTYLLVTPSRLYALVIESIIKLKYLHIILSSSFWREMYSVERMALTASSPVRQALRRPNRA
jgi:hypothetical protein